MTAAPAIRRMKARRPLDDLDVDARQNPFHRARELRPLVAAVGIELDQEWKGVCVNGLRPAPLRRTPPSAESGASPRSSSSPYPIVLRAIPVASDAAAIQPQPAANASAAFSGILVCRLFGTIADGNPPSGARDDPGAPESLCHLIRKKQGQIMQSHSPVLCHQSHDNNFYPNVVLLNDPGCPFWGILRMITSFVMRDRRRQSQR